MFNNQEMIQFWDWKDGRNILTTAQLRQALRYALVYEKREVKWVEKEIAKRYVNGVPHYSHY